MRVSFTWFGVRKTLTTEQRAEAAEHFGADGPFLSAAKKLLDTKDPAYRAVTSVRGQILAYWRGLTLPYPDPGVRLIRQDAVGAFDGRMAELRDELAERVEELDRRFDQLKRLGPAAAGEPVRRGRLPGEPARAVRNGVGLPGGRAAGLPAAAEPQAVRAGAGPRRRPVRRGGAAGRAGVHGGVRAARRSPGRAAGGRPRRRAEGVPRLGGGEPAGVLRAVHVAERAVQRRAGAAGRGGAGGAGGRRAAGGAGQRVAPRAGRGAAGDGAGDLGRDAGRPAAPPNPSAVGQLGCDGGVGCAAVDAAG